MTPGKLKETFEKPSLLVLSVDEISHILEQPSSFPLLLKNFKAEDLATKADNEPSLREVLKFVPEHYPPLEDGRTLACRDFWLQVALRDGKTADNLIMGLKFMDMGDGRYDISSPFIAPITKDFSYRAAFGHHVIERFETLTRDMLKKLQKPASL